jgi:hypothetical protein
MLHIYTLATNKYKLRFLKKTALNNNIKINYLLEKSWKGFHMKVNKMKKALKNLPKRDIVMFVDAYDVFINANEIQILDNFKSYNCEMVISSEINCYPGRLRERFDKTVSSCPTEFKYLNSGGYIGYVETVLDFLKWKKNTVVMDMCIREKWGAGDQNYFMENYLTNYSKIKNKIKLDNYCKIFLTMYGVSWDDINFKIGKVYYKKFEIYPCVIHFSGVESSLTKDHKCIYAICLDLLKKSLDDFNNSDDDANITLPTYDLSKYKQRKFRFIKD